MSLHLITWILLAIATRLASAYPPPQSYDSYEYESACVHCSSYVLSSAEDKEAVIMGKIRGTEYDYFNLPPFRTLCDAVSLLGNVDFNNIFDRFSDERPAAFDRFFHFTGVIASVKFEPGAEDYGFTGIFEGADHGVLRFSPIAPLLRETYLVNHFIGTYPYSFAVKFFRDGIHSGNINVGDSAKSLRAFSASRQFYDLPDFNIFSRVQDNMSGIGDTFDPLFGEFEKHSGVISPVDAAAYDEFGNPASPQVKTPVITSFRPNPDLTEKFGKGSLEFRKWATRPDAVPPGTLLYSVYTTIDRATSEPSLCVDDQGIPQVDDDVNIHCPDQMVIHLGNIVAKSRFFAAQWPDEWLFFQHHRMCPKDQSVCANDNDVDTPLPIDPVGEGLGNPDTTFPVDTSEFCLSSEDKSGRASGVPPSCPYGSTYVKSGCYAQVNSQLESAQQRTCPMMDKVATDILTVADGATEADLALPACNTQFAITNSFLTGMLTVLSPMLRGLVTFLPFTKPIVDLAIGLMPSGR